MNILSAFGLVLLAACSSALQPFLQIPNGRATEVLSDALVEMVDQVFAHQASHINIFAATIKRQNENDQKDAMDYVLKKRSGSIAYYRLEFSRTAPKMFLIKNMASLSLFFVDGYNSFV